MECSEQVPPAPLVTSDKNQSKQDKPQIRNLRFICLIDYFNSVVADISYHAIVVLLCELNGNYCGATAVLSASVSASISNSSAC